MVSALSAVPFNRGCDARCNGLPLAANPYDATHEHTASVAWRDGWLQTNKQWGKEAKWTVRTLPGVK